MAYSIQVLINVSIEPIVYKSVPCAIVGIVRGGVPPVEIELTIAEAEHLGEGVVPRVEQREEDHELHESAGQYADRDQIDIWLDGELFDAHLAKHGHTEAIEQTVGVDDRADDLGKVGQHQAPVGRFGPWVVVSVDQSRCEHKVQVLGELGTSVRVWFDLVAVVYSQINT